jgi:CBS-domain-containing membrane protein
MSLKARQFDAIAAIISATAVMLFVVLAKPGPFADLAWPWYVPLGTTIAVGVGLASSWLRSLWEVS